MLLVEPFVDLLIFLEALFNVAFEYNFLAILQENLLHLSGTGWFLTKLRQLLGDGFVLYCQARHRYPQTSWIS